MLQRVEAGFDSVVEVGVDAPAFAADDAELEPARIRRRLDAVVLHADRDGVVELEQIRVDVADVTEPAAGRVDGRRQRDLEYLRRHPELLQVRRMIATTWSTS